MQAKGFIQGAQLYLRTLTSDDVHADYLQWMNNPVINQYLESRFVTHNELDLQQFVDAMFHSPNDLFLAIVLNATHQHIGNIKLGNIHWVHRHAEVGIVIGAVEHHGKGYATAAIELLTHYAFQELGLRKITAGAYRSNGGSLKAFEKAGYLPDGIRKAHFFEQGQYVDQILLAAFAAEAIYTSSP